MYQTDPPLPAANTLPTMYDLPSENPEDPGVPDEFHIIQPELLRLTFQPNNYNPTEIFVATDLNLYYDTHHPQWYKRPDWFAVLGISRLYEEKDLRLSYVIWQEGINPFLVVELLSPGTEKEDLGQTLRDASKPPSKWEVYESILRIPYYLVFDRYTDQLKVFQLTGGKYQELQLTEPKVWLETIDIGIGIWQGSYQSIERKWLRFYDLEGNWISTPEDRANQAEKKAEQEKQRAEKLAAKLRELGV
jgi:Uma2 family endonuclease